MSWTDKYAVSQVLKLRDEYNISTFVETGSFRGVGSRFYSFHFRNVLSCDIIEEYLEIAKEYNKDRDNVFLSLIDSPTFLKNFVKEYNIQKRDDIVFMFLDAHFYDPSLPNDKKWVVVNELKSLYGFDKCVICIHDFDCSGLGHCVYDGEHLGPDIVMPHLNKVNPNFNYYVNYSPFVSIHDMESIKSVNEVIVDDLMVDTIKFVNENENRRKRGILYCTPTKLDLSRYELKKM